MNSSEMKEAFLIGYDKITNYAAKGYTDGEIQHFLNQAQFRAVKKRLPFFELTEEIRKDLSTLVNGFQYDKDDNLISEDVTTEDFNSYDVYNEYSKIFKFSDNVLKVVSEHIVDTAGKRIPVKPITHDELNVTVKNPFRKSNCKRALRLDFHPNSQVTNTLYHELILSADINFSKYSIRFVRYPSDIIIDSLNPKNCELPIQLHQEIIDEAVLLALENAESTRTSNFAQIKQ